MSKNLPKVRILVLALLVVLVLFTIAVPATAKGPFAKLVVYGNQSEVQITDPSLLSFDAFNVFAQARKVRPTVYGTGYLVVRYGFDQDTGKYVPFDSLRVFPAHGLQPDSFVYYEGLVNGWSEYDAKWYVANNQAINSLVAQVTQPAQPSIPFANPSLWILLAAILGLAAGAGGMYFFHRSRHAE